MQTLAEAVLKMDDEIKSASEVLEAGDGNYAAALGKAWQDLRKEIVFGLAGFQPYPHTHAVLIDLLTRGEVLRSVCMTPEDKPDRDRDLWDAAAAKARKLLGVE